MNRPTLIVGHLPGGLFLDSHGVWWAVDGVRGGWRLLETRDLASLRAAMDKMELTPQPVGGFRIP